MELYKDFLLSEILWYRIGGAAKYVLDVQTTEDVYEALKFIRTNNISNILVAGLGTNMLVSDEYFDGAVIHFVRKENSRLIKMTEQGLVECFGAELFDDLIHFCFENNLVGLEWAGGLPGTIGAGVRGNVGAFGGEIKDHLVEVDVLKLSDNTLELKTLSKEELEFSYRNSFIKKNKEYLVINARFHFEKGTEEELERAKKTFSQNVEYRKTNHPLEYPSAGSTFKNIKEKEKVEKVLAVYPDLQEKIETKWHGKVSVGHLITRLGLCGFKVGNAQVSEKHANFIVNLGGATFNDVYTVINTVKEKFIEKFGFPPEVEIEIVK